MDKDERAELARRVREARKANRLTQRQLAELAQVSLGMVNQLERGITVPQEGNLVRILGALGMAGDPEETREHWPDDIAVYLDVIGAVLAQFPPARRQRLMREMTRWIVERRDPRTVDQLAQRRRPGGSGPEGVT